MTTAFQWSTTAAALLAFSAAIYARATSGSSARAKQTGNNLLLLTAIGLPSLIPRHFQISDRTSVVLSTCSLILSLLAVIFTIRTWRRSP